MPMLRIQHTVPDFETWKRTFDRDPADRKGSGVRGYQIHRSVTDPNLVMIDLLFDRRDDAERLLHRLQSLWSGPGAALMRNPEAWVVDTVETISL